MRLVLLIAGLLLQDPTETRPSEPETAYRLLESRLREARRVFVVYRRTCDASDRSSVSGHMTLTWNTRENFNYRERNHDWYTHSGRGGWGGSVEGTGGPRIYNRPESLAAGGLLEVLRHRSGHREFHGNEHLGIPTHDLSAFALAEDKGLRVLSFNLGCEARSARELKRHEAKIRLWLDPKTGWPVRRTFEEVGEGATPRVHTEVYYRFDVDAPPLKDAAVQVLFPAPNEVKALAAKDPHYPRILEDLQAPENWKAVIQEIEAVLCPYPKSTNLRVRFTESDESPGSEVTRDRSGITVTFNVKLIDAFRARWQEVALANSERSKQGKPLEFERVPSMYNHVARGLVHVLERGRQLPGWFHQGVPSWLWADMYYVKTFLDRAAAVEEIDAKPASAEDDYGRGHLFLLWLERKAGAGVFPALARSVYEEGLDVQTAISRLLGAEWAEIKREELAGSRQYAAIFKSTPAPAR